MSSSTESEHNNRLWEHGDSCSDDSTSFLMSIPTTLSEQAMTTHSSQISTPGLNSPMSAIALSPQESTNFFLHQVPLYRENKLVAHLRRVSFTEITI